MSRIYQCTKYIEIDAAHRVTYHDSKCKNVHGHRYRVEMSVIGDELQEEGSSQGMLIDFSFMKELLMEFVDYNCDHGIILWKNDPLVFALVPEVQNDENTEEAFKQADSLIKFGAYLKQGPFGKIYLVPFVPTAENLARHWYELLQERVVMRSHGYARLQRIRVYETPSSIVDYPSF